MTHKIISQAILIKSLPHPKLLGFIIIFSEGEDYKGKTVIIRHYVLPIITLQTKVQLPFLCN